MASSRNDYCCVPQCNSWSRKKGLHTALSFHLFPKENQSKVYLETAFGRELVDRRKAWILKLKIGKRVTEYMKVCSLHFSEDDYFHKGEKKRSKLKQTAVPSKNLPSTSVPSKNLPSTSVVYDSPASCSSSHETVHPEASLSSRTKRYNSRVEKKECVNDSCCAEVRSEEDMQAAKALIDLLNSGTEMSEDLVEEVIVPQQTRDFNIQVDTSTISTLTDLLKDEKSLKCFTGINSQILDSIEKLFSEVSKDTRQHRLNIRQRIILTFTKMKLDLSYVTLSILFGISQQVCKTYFYETLSVLHVILKPTVYFPSVEEIQRNMPICFTGFENTRVVLDCTEIYTQKPSCLCCRIKFYSQYKSSTTVKFMTGVSPGGIITFISEPYGGRASDKTIFEESGLIDKLIPQRDAVMVDKGFLIEDFCSMHGIEIIRPPFLKKKKQLSPEESLRNQKIASALVHIERANQRLKIFKILSGKIEWRLIPKVHEIFTIACAITNLSNPILSDERF